MSALRVLPRLAAARNFGLSCSSLRVVRSSSLNLCLRSSVYSPQAASQAFHNTSIRYISQANKDKVNERNEAIKKDLTIEDLVKKIVAEQLGVKVEEVVNTASFVDDLGADSLDTVELVMALEEEFNTEIPDEEAERIKNVQHAIDYIKTHKG